MQYAELLVAVTAVVMGLVAELGGFAGAGLVGLVFGGVAIGLAMARTGRDRATSRASERGARTRPAEIVIEVRHHGP